MAGGGQTARELEEYAEEHGGEEGLLSDALGDKGNLTRKGVTDRLKDSKHDPDSGEEREVLERALSALRGELPNLRLNAAANARGLR